MDKRSPSSIQCILAKQIYIRSLCGTHIVSKSHYGSYDHCLVIILSIVIFCLHQFCLFIVMQRLRTKCGLLSDDATFTYAQGQSQSNNLYSDLITCFIHYFLLSSLIRQYLAIYISILNKNILSVKDLTSNYPKIFF